LNVHEFAMTTQIVESVLKEAEKHKAKKVKDVHLIIGALTFLRIEQVQFAFDVLKKDTLLDGAKLHIEEKPGYVKCSKCGYEGYLKMDDDPAYHVPAPFLRCPECEAGVEIIEGRECTIRRVKMIR
jgi:hydrogenase nickel incorporation protein HypA/HybF